YVRDKIKVKAGGFPREKEEEGRKKECVHPYTLGRMKQRGSFCPILYYHTMQTIAEETPATAPRPSQSVVPV
ncbi:MAG: hypothetical protein WCR47_08675, partial [Desulfoplanes sp.]